MKKSTSILISLSRTIITAIIGAGSLVTFSQTGFSAPVWVTWETSVGGNGHQYLAVPRFAGLTWNMANTLAQQQNGYLATITSQAENNFVFGLINSPQFFTSFNGSGPAIGGFQPVGSPESDGGWSWVTAEAWNYTNWRPGSPDGGTAENNLHFFSGTLGQSTPAATWNDINANDTNIGGYVVEVAPEPSSLTIIGCAILLFARRITAKHK